MPSSEAEQWQAENNYKCFIFKSQIEANITADYITVRRATT